MKTRLLLSLVLGLTVGSVLAAPLRVAKVNAPAYNCLFNTNCTITVNDTTAAFTTNLPPGSTNGSLTGFLQSRTFQGQPGSPEAGLYGYEYRLVLNKLTGASSVTIRSMTVDFSPYSSFTYQNQPNQQAWEVTSGGLGSTGPRTASVSGSKVTFRFFPPLVLSSASGQDASTYFFGMISSVAPPATANRWATFEGLVTPAPGGAAVPFNFLAIQARAP